MHGDPSMDNLGFLYTPNGRSELYANEMVSVSHIALSLCKVLLKSDQ